MVVLGPVRIWECFLLVAKTRPVVVPRFEIKRTTMFTIEAISKLHSINCEIFFSTSITCPTSNEKMKLLGTFTFNIKVKNALIPIMSWIIKLSNRLGEVLFTKARINPAFQRDTAPVNLDFYSWWGVNIPWKICFWAFGVIQSFLIVSIKMNDSIRCKIRCKRCKNIVFSSHHAWHFAHIRIWVFETLGPGKILCLDTSSWNSCNDAKHDCFHP